DLQEVNGVRFRTAHPIAAGFGGALPAVFRVPAQSAAIARVRGVGTLGYALQVLQGQTVATLSLDGRQVPLRAGIELAERAFDRPSLKGQVAHARATVATDTEDATPDGEIYFGHLYSFDIAVPEPQSASSLSVAPTDPKVLVEVHGLSLVGP